MTRKSRQPSRPTRATPKRASRPQQAKASRVRGAPSMQGAPVAVSQDMQQYTKFSAGSDSDSIRMHTCAAIAQIRNQVTVPQGPAFSFPASIEGMSCQLNLTQPASLRYDGSKANTSFVSPVFDLIASAFVKYRVHKLVFHYEPQCAATEVERLVFAYAEDPMHPVLWNATVPTSTSLLALADSVAFAPWRSWSMDVTHRLARQEFYTFTDSSTTVASFAERFSDFGVMSCVTSGSGAVANVTCGVLYMETVIELIEFCPISVTLPASKFLAQKFTDDSVAAASSYSAPTPDVKALSVKELRRLCELEVRKLEYTDPRTYAFFRKAWSDDIVDRPLELLLEIKEKTSGLDL